MSRPPVEPIERRLERAARAFPYPATPSLVGLREPPRPRRGRGFSRRPLLAALAALVVLAALFAVPGVRAAVRGWLIGVIEVIPASPAASPSPAGTTATPAASSTPLPSSTVAPASPSVDAGALRGLVGPTSLDDARRRFRLPLRTPGYPTDLGPPDRVYLQDLDGAAAILVWLDPADPSRVRLSLHQLLSPVFGRKTDVSPENARKTTVAGRDALWIDAPHLLEVYNAQGDRAVELRRLVQGNVLLWEQDGVTYRLESDLTLDEAIRVAESLK